MHGEEGCVMNLYTTKDELTQNGRLTSGINRKPAIKDVVPVPSAGCARIRLKTHNPGFWFFHCHLEFHMHAGMAAIIQIGEKKDMLPSPPGFPTCGNYLNKIEGKC